MQVAPGLQTGPGAEGVALYGSLKLIQLIARLCLSAPKPGHRSNPLYRLNEPGKALGSKPDERDQKNNKVMQNMGEYGRGQASCVVAQGPKNHT